MEEYCKIHDITVEPNDHGYKFKRGNVGTLTDKNFMIQCIHKIPTNLSTTGGTNIIDIDKLLTFYKEILERQIDEYVAIVCILFSSKDLVLNNNEIIMKIKTSPDKNNYDLITVDYMDINRLHCILDIYPSSFFARTSTMKFVD